MQHTGVSMRHLHDERLRQTFYLQKAEKKKKSSIESLIYTPLIFNERDSSQTLILWLSFFFVFFNF